MLSPSLKYLLITLIFMGQNVNAQVNLDSLFSVWNNPATSDSNKLSAIESISWNGFMFSDPDSAHYYADFHFKLAQACIPGDQDNSRFYKKHMAIALNTQGTSYYFKGDYDAALALYQRSLDLRKEVGDEEKIASSLKNMSAILGEKGDYEEAVKLLNESLELYELIDDEEGMAGVYNNLGIAFKAQGIYAEAITQYNRAWSIFNTKGNKRYAASALNNIANVYRAQKDYPNALKFFGQSLSTREEIGDKQGVLTTLNNIGNIYLDLDSPESRNTKVRPKVVRAEPYFIRAHDLAQELGSKKEIAISLNGIGHVALLKNRVDTAIHCFSEALAIRTELGKKAGMSSSHNLLADAYLEKYESTMSKGRKSSSKKLLDMAIIHAEEALAISTSIHHLVQVKNATGILHECFRHAGDFENALEMHELYQTAKDSLMSEKNQNAIIHQQYRYAYDKKVLRDSLDLLGERRSAAEREEAMSNEISSQFNLIQLLLTAFVLMIAAALIYRLNLREKKMQAKAEANMLKFKTAESEMKALRSQMNPHFIFNALQSIQAFLIDQNTEDANEYLLKFSKLMRAVLENSEKDEVPIGDEKKALELYMQLESIRLKHPFTFTFNIDDSVDIESDMIPPLILQPVIENSIWHGLQQKDGQGHIQIDIRKEGAKIYCIVEDDGIGRLASQALKQDFQLRKDSLGMKITAERIRVRDELNQTHGELKIVDLVSASGEATGTRVELIIPCLA